MVVCMKNDVSLIYVCINIIYIFVCVKKMTLSWSKFKFPIPYAPPLRPQVSDLRVLPSPPLYWYTLLLYIYHYYSYTLYSYFLDTCWGQREREGGARLDVVSRRLDTPHIPTLLFTTQTSPSLRPLSLNSEPLNMDERMKNTYIRTLVVVYILRV